MKNAVLIALFSLLALIQIGGVQAQTGSNTTIKAVGKATEASEPSTTAANSNRAVPAVTPPDDKPSPAPHETTSAPASEPTSSTRPANSDAVSTTSTASTDEPALTETYTVGVGDVLDIRLINSPSNRSTLYSVIEGGLIDLPIAGGPVSVAGLTTKDIQARITSQLKRLAVEDRTQVAVGVRQYGSHAVVITGLVGSPGTKFLRREAVPLYVLLAEVQPRLDAARASVMRSGGSTYTVELANAGALSFLVRPGDVITLTARPQEFYYIGGRIDQPGQKAFQPGITLIQAILAAGGSARNNAAELSREGTDGRLVSTKYNLKEIKAGKLEDPKLQAGDRVEVLK